MLGRQAWCGWNVIVAVVVAAVGCGGDDAIPTDAGVSDACAALTEPLSQPGDPIDGDNYSNLAQPFFETYCIGCHASTRVTPGDRQGAPPGRDWDQESIVRMHLPEIRSAVGETNFMPFRAPFPTCDERARLVRWIDADAP